MENGEWKMGAARDDLTKRPFSIFHFPFSSYLGPAFLTASVANEPNFSKFALNIWASLAACASYAFLSFHVLRGTRTFGATSLIFFGTARPNTGSFTVGVLLSSPRSMAFTMLRVRPSFMREPTP